MFPSTTKGSKLHIIQLLESWQRKERQTLMLSFFNIIESYFVIF